MSRPVRKKSTVAFSWQTFRHPRLFERRQVIALCYSRLDDFHFSYRIERQLFADYGVNFLCPLFKNNLFLGHINSSL